MEISAMPKTYRKYRRHIRELARHLGVTVNAWKDAVPCACQHQGWKQITIPPIHTEATYAIALHELGHHATRRRTVIDREVAAWEWAKSQALVWTPWMQVTAMRGLHSYLQHAARCLRMRWPDDDHQVWTWIARGIYTPLPRARAQRRNSDHISD
jgi:hypothetical protein